MRFSNLCMAIGLILACQIMAVQGALAADKAPSAYDGSRDSAIDNGHQNMPFVLYGVAIKWDAACRGGDTAQCLHLGEAFRNGEGDLKPDLRVTLGYAKLACAQGNGDGCARAAAIILDGTANFSDPNLALTTARRGCDLKNSTACALVAAALKAGGGTAEEQAQAGQIMQSSCDQGADEGCRLKARALFYDSNDTAARAQAIPLFQKACAAKRAWGCNGLADAYDKGWGVSADRTQAMAYAKTGCTEGQGSLLEVCRQYGTYLTYGSDKAGINKGEQYLNTACMAGDAGACVWLGKLGLRDKQGATTTMLEGLFYERRGCDLGDPAGCDELALAYSLGNGINPDSAVAIALYDKACRMGLSDSCQAANELLQQDPGARAAIPAIDPSLPAMQQIGLGIHEVDSGDRMLGVTTVYRLTQEGNDEAEWILGGWMYYGLDGIFDPPRQDDGVILIENAARVGHVEAAMWMGMAYWYGDGVPEDHDKGQNYMAIAAVRGSDEAKAIYRSMLNEPARQEMAERQRRMEEAMIDHRSVWEKAFDAWDAALASGTWMSSYAPSSVYSGPSTSDIMRESNWNQAFNYLSGSTTACPQSNPYCN